jgi:AcrR family transcriptional regulator
MERKLLFQHIRTEYFVPLYARAIPQTPRTSLSGRAAQAARNDQLILEAAREVFLDDPDAPITAVAKRAGVGISALYTRYGSKDELLRKLSRDGLERILEEIDVALRDERDPWNVFAAFMLCLVDADVAALTLSLAGKFNPTEDMFALAGRTDTELKRLFRRFNEVLRPGVAVQDIWLALEIVGTIKLSDRARTKQLRRRYLTVILDGLRADHTEPLPGPPPSRQEVNERWETRS